jgi:protein PhnA
VTNTTCALCGSPENLRQFHPSGTRVPADSGLALACTICEICENQLNPGAVLDVGHWRCLQTSAWSDSPAVQVLAWRLLGRLGETWASDLRDQLYLEPETLAWAESEPEAEGVPANVVRDCNGVPLQEGDSVVIIKDLDVKGAGFVAKRGTLVKGIRLGDDPTHVEGKVNGTSIYLKVEFLKRA